MYNAEVLSQKLDVITAFHYSVTPENCCENYRYVIILSSDGMLTKFE